jgi:hypothetical protein
MEEARRRGGVVLEKTCDRLVGQRSSMSEVSRACCGSCASVYIRSLCCINGMSSSMVDGTSIEATRDKPIV